MVKPVSALFGHFDPGQFGESGNAGVEISEVGAFTLIQLAGWPETMSAAGKVAASVAGVSKAQGPGIFQTGKKADLLRVEPLKWWLLSEGEAAFNSPEIDPKKGCVLDLSHSRAWIKIGGEKAETLLNNFLPVDLRPQSFPAGTVITTAMHHSGVTLWRDKKSFNLMLPRSFSVSLWEQFMESALQYGLLLRQ